MEGILYKEDKNYVLEVHINDIPARAKIVGQSERHPDWVIIALTEKNTKYLKLSIENCIAVNVNCNLEQLAKSNYHTSFNDYEEGVDTKSSQRLAFKKGFIKAIETVGKFNKNDMLNFAEKCLTIANNTNDIGRLRQFVIEQAKALEKNKWFVKIETYDQFEQHQIKHTKLDESSCLILTVKEN